MSLEVLLTADAAADLAEIVDHVVAADGAVRAGRVLDRIEQCLASLHEMPQRGAHPPELLALGIREYREIFFKPYRLICRVDRETVNVYLIVDGRRDMQRLLMRRLLGA